MRERAFRRACVGGLIAVHVLLSVLAMRHESPMTDEGGHYRYGLGLLEGRTAFEDSPYGVGKMPFSAFNALPWELAQKVGLERALIRLATRNRSPAPSTRSVPREEVFPVLTGRLATVVFSALLAWVVFRWSSRLYGFSGGLVSLFLYSFCPNLLAHSHLVMLDLYAALGVTVASYFFWLYLRRGGWRWASLSALVLGLAQLTKYTCLYLYPVFALIGLIHSWPRWVECLRSRDPRLWRRRLTAAALVVGLFLAALLAALNIGYLGQGTLTPLSKYTFQSETFQSLQRKVVEIVDVPVPVPSTPVIGLDALRHYEREGRYFPNLYLLGELRLSGQPDLEGFKSYYLVSWLFKVPIGTQLVLLLALGAHLRRKGREYLTVKELALIGPLVFYALFFSLGYKAQIGLRHFLVVFPLVFVLCGAAAGVWRNADRRLRLSAGALAVYIVGSVLSYYPHFLAYFNELVWDRKQAHKIVADSSIDMQGNDWFIEDYLAEHPGTPVNPRYIDRPGKILVEVNLLTGVLTDKMYAWLRESFEPVDHVAHSYLVYDIRPEDMHLVPRRPPPTTAAEMTAWIAANLPHGAAILREDGTPDLDPELYLTEHRRSLGRVSRQLLTGGRWDFALVAHSTRERALQPDAIPDEERERITQQYREILSWPVAVDFRPADGLRGPGLTLYRIRPDESAPRDRRHWKASDVAWVSDPAIRPTTAEGPLTFTRRWQAATFKGRFDAGLYEIKLATEPARLEAYVELVTLDNREIGPFRAGRATIVELPSADKYLLRVYLEPGASLSEVVLRPAPAGAVAAEALARGAR